MGFAHEYATAVAQRGRVLMEPADFVPDWADKPRRVKFRAASFVNLQPLERMAMNHMIADLVAIIGTADAVLGDVDR